MLYLAKGTNTYPHVKGKNVWYMTKNKAKLSDHKLSTKIEEFKRLNDLLSHIHSSKLAIIELN